MIVGFNGWTCSIWKSAPQVRIFEALQEYRAGALIQALADFCANG